MTIRSGVLKNANTFYLVIRSQCFEKGRTLTNADSQSQDEWAAEMSSTAQHFTSSFVSKFVCIPR